jgi:hypothetical protein
VGAAAALVVDAVVPDVALCACPSSEEVEAKTLENVVGVDDDIPDDSDGCWVGFKRGVAVDSGADDTRLVVDCREVASKILDATFCDVGVAVTANFAVALL